MNNLIKYYRSPDPALWNGRLSDPSSLNQYWHEVIKFYHDGLEHLKSERLNSDFGILGYACDEGVKRNNGRQGAVNGPKAIREQLSKLSAHFSEKTVTDYGDIVAYENNIELAQKLFSNVMQVFKESDFAITDLSHSRTIIELEGENSKEVLKKGCPFNFNILEKNNSINSTYNGIAFTVDVLDNNPDKIKIGRAHV